MRLIQTLLVLAVFALAMTGCKKKMPDTAKVAKTFCACNSDVEVLTAEMKAATGDQEKLKEIAGRLADVNTKAADCIKTNVGKYTEAFKSEDFKSGLLNAMESSCPQAARLYSRFVN